MFEVSNEGMGGSVLCLKWVVKEQADQYYVWSEQWRDGRIDTMFEVSSEGMGGSVLCLKWAVKGQADRYYVWSE